MAELIKTLTKNEELVLYGLVKFPDKNDKQLAQLLQMKDSTLTSIKKRLEEQNFFQTFYIPMLNRLGCELLGIISTSFNPIIPLKERVSITSEKIEVSEEIFLSFGELEKGFSLSLNENYSSFSQINETRTQTFGQLGLLDQDFPNEMIFPFKLSTIKRFFDCSALLESFFNIQPIVDEENRVEDPKWQDIKYFGTGPEITLSLKEKKVLIALIQSPNETMENIGNDPEVNLSRHTVARMKKKFLDENLLQKLVMPDLTKIGYNILVFYDLKFSPNDPPKWEDLAMIDSSSTLFYVYRKFSAVIISVYSDYAEYKEDKMKKFAYLKDHNILTYNPSPKKYVFEQMEIIKYFVFAPITKKILLANEINIAEAEKK